MPAAPETPVEPTGDARDAREITATMDLALRIGELLLSSGAGASDVSAAMNNVARACGLRGYTADVTFTALTMSQQSSPGRSTGWRRRPGSSGSARRATPDHGGWSPSPSG